MADLSPEFKAAADDRIGKILDRLKTVPAGQDVVTFLKDNNVKIELYENPYNWAASTLTIKSIKNGIYEYHKPFIILKEGLSDDNLLQAIVHETGHLNQHLASVGNPDRILSPEQYILFYRASEADAQAMTTEVTWQLKQKGDSGPWDATKFVGYGDICDAYEKAVTADPSLESDGRAKRVAFDAWFDKPERLAGYNKATVEGMIPFLESNRKNYKDHGLVEKALDDSWLKKLDGASTQTYLLLAGARDVLTDAYYSKDTDARPPTPANNNKPAAPSA